MTDLEFTRESAVVDRLYERLDELKTHALTRLAEVRAQEVGGNHQARSERDAFAHMYEERVLALRDVSHRLVFGRLELDGAPGVETADASASGSETDGGAAGDSEAVALSASGSETDAASAGRPTASGDEGPDERVRYIGRIDLRDVEHRSLLLDWRAPQSSAFYQATAAHPMGVRVRRHLTVERRRLKRIDDEVFDRSLLVDRDSDAPQLQGEAALLAAVTEQRTGHMRDIVSTIQSEQDRIIRSEMRGALVVQGGPGTGKTAVALHRAAYLLYTHREKLGSAGVLVVGPSSVFLDYIGQVLPSLGESGVVLQSLGDLYPGHEVSDDDAPEVAAVKGARGMPALIRRAVRSRQRVPSRTQTIAVNNERLEVGPDLIAEAMAAAQAKGKPHNEARVTFVSHALDALTELLAGRLRTKDRTLDENDLAVLREDIRTSYDARVVLNTAWLPLTPEKLLRDLYARPTWLAELTPNWPEERRALLRRDRDAPFTVSDIPLLDEAAGLLGHTPSEAHDEERRQQQYERDLDNARHAIENAGVEGQVTPESLVDRFEADTSAMTTAERAASDREWTYGHIVVDEAQELSFMQWRMLLRRCPLRSFTIVGDIAQASGASASSSWDQALGRAFKDRWRLEELTVNYRTPARVMREAEEFAAEHGLTVTPSRSVREGDWPVEHVTVRGADVARSASATADAAADAVAGAPVDAASVDADALDADAPLTEACLAAVDRARSADPEGTVAVIVPRGRLDEVSGAVAEAQASGASQSGEQAERGQAERERTERGQAEREQVERGRVSVLTPQRAKGLEFDAVVLVDPEGIMADSSRGASDVYVAMTRCTQRLIVVHTAE